MATPYLSNITYIYSYLKNTNFSHCHNRFSSAVVSLLSTLCVIRLHILHTQFGGIRSHLCDCLFNDSNTRSYLKLECNAIGSITNAYTRSPEKSVGTTCSYFFFLFQRKCIISSTSQLVKKKTWCSLCLSFVFFPLCSYPLLPLYFSWKKSEIFLFHGLNGARRCSRVHHV